MGIKDTMPRIWLASRLNKAQCETSFYIASYSYLTQEPPSRNPSTNRPSGWPSSLGTGDKEREPTHTIRLWWWRPYPLWEDSFCKLPGSAHKEDGGLMRAQQHSSDPKLHSNREQRNQQAAQASSHDPTVSNNRALFRYCFIEKKKNYLIPSATLLFKSTLEIAK